MQDIETAKQKVLEAQCQVNAAESKLLAMQQSIKSQESAHKRAALEGTRSQLPVIQREVLRHRAAVQKAQAQELVCCSCLFLL